MTDTDKTTETSATDKITVDSAGAASVDSSVKNKRSDADKNKATDKNKSSEKSKGSGKNKFMTYFLILLVILVIALGAALFYQQQQYQTIKQDLQSLSSSNVALVQKAESNAAAALQATKDQNEKIIAINKVLETTNNQLQEIDRALQLVTDSGSDLLLLNDIDHLVTVAEQQLLLGGNVANAIISLEAAQAQLARANRAAFVSLQQAINGDLDRLRAVSKVNLSALSNKVDDLVALIGSAPLIVPDMANSQLTDEQSSTAPEPTPENSDNSATDTNSSITELEYWNQLGQGLWQQSKELGASLTTDLKELFDIRKVDDEAALLMSPDQAQRFRENLSQRAITAQLALLMQQTKIWHEELEKIAAAISKRYDMNSQQARNALNLARELYDTTIEAQLPKLTNTLSAIASVRDDISAKETKAAADTLAVTETN